MIFQLKRNETENLKYANKMSRQHDRLNDCLHIVLMQTNAQVGF